MLPDGMGDPPPMGNRLQSAAAAAGGFSPPSPLVGSVGGPDGGCVAADAERMPELARASVVGIVPSSVGETGRSDLHPFTKQKGHADTA